MLELLLLAFGILVLVLVAKFVFAVLGLAFHIALFPLKVLGGLFLLLLSLPLLLVVVPLAAVAAVGLGVTLLFGGVLLVVGALFAL